MRFGWLFLLLAVAVAGAQTPVAEPLPKVQAWREAQARWQTIEPELFAGTSFRLHVGEGVLVQARLLSGGSPLKARTDAGTTILVTHVNQADRAALREFRRAPAKIDVEGIIRSVDRSTRTITLQSISTSFGP